MTTQIIPVKCPYLNTNSNMPANDVLVKLVDDIPVSVVCTKVKLQGAGGIKIEDLIQGEQKSAEISIPENSNLVCSHYDIQCVYTRPFIRFRKDQYDNDINHA
jgi:hypothetical protein